MSYSDNDKEQFPGYPLYPDNKDIYNKGIKEEKLDVDDLSKLKTGHEKGPIPNEKDFEADVSGNDLDVPGAELDDENEITGNEDEENNYYSLGGDNHLDLEENTDGQL